MENISPTTLPNFHGLSCEDPETFMIDFGVFFRTYDYASDEQKLKPFPSTLEDATLHWFMSLPRGSITT